MIQVYSANWCAFCHQTMAYFDKLGIKYEKLDVEENQANATASVEKSGQMGIPVIDIDGTIIVGFDKPQIDATLRKNKLLTD